MTGVMKNFYIASMFIWVARIVILYGFNHNLFLGSGLLSSFSLTLVIGFIAVVSININMVIALYVYIAMKEQNSDKHKSDPKVLADAKASASQFPSNETEEDSSSTRLKRE